MEQINKSRKEMKKKYWEYFRGQISIKFIYPQNIFKKILHASVINSPALFMNVQASTVELIIICQFY